MGASAELQGHPPRGLSNDCKGHGQLEIRRHWLLDSVEHLVDTDQWVGLKRVGLIESERRLPG